VRDGRSEVGGADRPALYVPVRSRPTNSQSHRFFIYFLLSPSFTDLTKLSLYRILLDNNSGSPSVLRNVQELTCNGVNTTHPDPSSFLSPFTFPSLSALAFGTEFPYVDSEVSLSLIAQLNLLVFLDPSIPSNATFPLLPRSCLFCTSFPLERLRYIHDLLLLFTHIRMRSAPKNIVAAMRVASGLEELAETLYSCQDKSTFRLVRLSLPTELDPANVVDYAHGSALEFAVEAVLETCADHDVEVVFEDGEEQEGGSFLPLRTVEWAKTMRRAEGEGNGDRSRCLDEPKAARAGFLLPPL
jgi:hypothetical protein